MGWRTKIHSLKVVVRGKWNWSGVVVFRGVYLFWVGFGVVFGGGTRKFRCLLILCEFWFFFWIVVSFSFFYQGDMFLEITKLCNKGRERKGTMC